MSLKTPDPMAATSAHPKPTSDPAALIASILRFADAHYAREHWLAARDFLSMAVEIDPNYPLGALGSLQLGRSPIAIIPASNQGAMRGPDPRAKNSYVEQSRTGRVFRRFRHSIQILCWHA